MGAKDQGLMQPSESRMHLFLRSWSLLSQGFSWRPSELTAEMAQSLEAGSLLLLLHGWLSRGGGGESNSRPLRISRACIYVEGRHHAYVEGRHHAYVEGRHHAYAEGRPDTHPLSHLPSALPLQRLPPSVSISALHQAGLGMT